MIATSALCQTRKSYTRFLVHLVDGDLTNSIEEAEQSCGCCFHKVVVLVYSMRCRFDVRGFETIQWFNGDDFGSRPLVLRDEDFPGVINNATPATEREW
jgi:hypothetical protein